MLIGRKPFRVLNGEGSLRTKLDRFSTIEEDCQQLVFRTNNVLKINFAIELILMKEGAMDNVIGESLFDELRKATSLTVRKS